MTSERKKHFMAYCRSLDIEKLIGQSHFPALDPSFVEIGASNSRRTHSKITRSTPGKLSFLLGRYILQARGKCMWQKKSTMSKCFFLLVALRILTELKKIDAVHWLKGPYYFPNSQNRKPHCITHVIGRMKIMKLKARYVHPDFRFIFLPFVEERLDWGNELQL